MNTRQLVYGLGLAIIMGSGSLGYSQSTEKPSQEKKEHLERREHTNPLERKAEDMNPTERARFKEFSEKMEALRNEYNFPVDKLREYQQKVRALFQEYKEFLPPRPNMGPGEQGRMEGTNTFHPYMPNKPDKPSMPEKPNKPDKIELKDKR
ncbi:MAG: hypothetical protein WCK90_04645 [archaeon]